MTHVMVARLMSSMFLAAVLTACSPAQAPLASTSAALTAAQCDYFEEGGKVTICHQNNSARNPIVQITVATSACVDAHSAHANDYIAMNGSCGAGACLAAHTPCDLTLPCCDGACTNGVCPEAPREESGACKGEYTVPGCSCSVDLPGYPSAGTACHDAFLECCFLNADGSIACLGNNPAVTYSGTCSF